eukprot:scaffold339_cov402-Prasinococcus_capsulatus_cf.AAC.14
MSKAPAVISPHLDQGTVDLANLQALQRIEAGVESILLRAGQVAVYSLDLELHEWTRKDVEGSCFVVKCATAVRVPPLLVLLQDRRRSLLRTVCCAASHASVWL